MPRSGQPGGGLGGSGSVDVAGRVRAAFDRLAEVDRPDVWVTLRDRDAVLADARAVAARLDAGEVLPLAGMLVAVKDNIDVAGVPTTAGCPAFAFTPGTSASVVCRLCSAGAVVLGKTTLDQFATGLAGSRTPAGPVRSAVDPDRVAGGSSAGSAVAVALGVVDVALGTDTAGSGRVPAAFNGIVGLKPTRGLVPATGVVPASPSYDCVSVLARRLDPARRALAAILGPDSGDPRSRAWPPSARLAAGPRPRLGVPDDTGLAPLSPAARATFDSAVAVYTAAGAVVERVDITPLTEASALYGTVMLAERAAAVGEFLAAHRDEVDPVVASVVLAAGDLPAARLAADLDRLAGLAAEVAPLWRRHDALLLPTVPEHPTIAAVLADPVVVPARLGRYAAFANLLDLAAVAVPAGTADGGPFGVSVLVPAFADQVALDVAAVLTDEPELEPYPVPALDLVVFGPRPPAVLVELGARPMGPVRTTPGYRGVPAPTDLAVAALHAPGGGSLAGERWRLPPAALDGLLAALPPGVALGPLELADGTPAVAPLAVSR
ncbi:allophanate hydrolase [Amycolatopsis arida]|uniref:allophanate hydrolase n=1 Tax=Amycolatopsis arida TaxID=587909 RepID=UPI001FB86EFC|nr:allophanate hydrolase [Amycolatopsis arida]